MSIFKTIVDFFARKKKKNSIFKIITKGVPLSKNLNFLQKLIETNPNPMYYVDERGVLRYCNKTFADYLGKDKATVLDREFASICFQNSSGLYYELDKELSCTKEKQVSIAKLKCQGQLLKYVTITQTKFLGDNGELKGVVGNITDISEPLMSEKKIRGMLKLKEAMLDINKIIIKENDINVMLNLVLEKVTAAMEKANIGAVLVLDKDENLKIVASRGYEEEEVNRFSVQLSQVFYMKKNKGVIGNTIIIDDIQNLDLSQHKIILDSKERAKLRCSISTPILLDGKLYGFINVESTKNNAFDENDIEVLDYLKQQIEVGISKIKLYEKTVYLSRYDKLTDIYNRGYFEEILNKSLEKAKEKNEEFLLVIFDLNFLKVANDSCGHLAGDEVIRTFATTLNNRIGINDVLARIGGDEFAAIIYDMNLQQLVEMLEKVNSEFKDNPISFDNHDLICSFSYGISRYLEDGNSYNSLVKAADKRMYEYKNKLK